MAEFVSIIKPVLNTDFGFILFLRAWSSRDGRLRFCLFLFLYETPASLVLSQFYVDYMGFLRPGSPLYEALRGSIFAVIA